MTTVTVIGLGEAGAHYARGLRDAGFSVAGFDPFATLDEEGIVQHASLEQAVSTADVAISLVGARAALDVASQAIPAMRSGAVFADFNTAAPDLKSRMGEAAAASDVLAADVAVLAPVPRKGAQTPLMVSGSGADRFVELLRPLGAPIESIGGDPGDAAGRKLLRSVFMKGLAAVVIESVRAAESVGKGDWLREQIADEFAGEPHALIERLIRGSEQHADRRAHETQDAADYLASLGQRNWTTTAAHTWLTALREESGNETGATPGTSRKDKAQA